MPVAALVGNSPLLSGEHKTCARPLLVEARQERDSFEPVSGAWVHSRVGTHGAIALHGTAEGMQTSPCSRQDSQFSNNVKTLVAAEVLRGLGGVQAAWTTAISARWGFKATRDLPFLHSWAHPAVSFATPRFP